MAGGAPFAALRVALSPRASLMPRRRRAFAASAALVTATRRAGGYQRRHIGSGVRRRVARSIPPLSPPLIRVNSHIIFADNHATLR